MTTFLSWAPGRREVVWFTSGVGRPSLPVAQTTSRPPLAGGADLRFRAAVETSISDFSISA
jgi:hypothetical protein